MKQNHPQVFTDGQLPAPMQADMNALMSAMAKRYGPAATRMGIHIENLATVCAMLAQSGAMDDATREKAWHNAKDVCGAVILDLGRASNVDAESAFAVARALKEHSQHISDELCGEELPQETAAAAAQVMARAAAN